jgi:hypothetical protein
LIEVNWRCGTDAGNHHAVMALIAVNRVHAVVRALLRLSRIAARPLQIER